MAFDNEQKMGLGCSYSARFIYVLRRSREDSKAAFFALNTAFSSEY